MSYNLPLLFRMGKLDVEVPDQISSQLKELQQNDVFAYAGSGSGTELDMVNQNRL